MIKLDQRDLAILRILQDEGRITKTALAERIHLSPAPCWDRLKRLENAGIITGYGAKICLDKLGVHTTVFLQAEISSHQSQDFSRFEDYIAQHQAISECWAIGGGFDYLLKIDVPTIDSYQQLVDTMLNANIGLKRYYTYIVTKRIKSKTALPLDFLPVPDE
ncbi:Lrp/AsnC family transcriptional regulator [Ostreibacterium oceani]|uniref:Winged helix-turn-helix transcriptional regulator n=1 Tax=Ostreibacterium oceani TaxID=2654998 RepID=A0A6N7EY03_9GAMM|nr:Lrp/AsnC family transcriptional regulator [Ostreibacterium oceani]MPV86007.1 winged helix-turn-helix transcriptional regulator [Ostreibacterium oceani]